MSGSGTNTSPFPNPRRVITGHSSTGQPVIVLDEVTEPKFWAPKSISGVFDIYRTDEVPASNDAVQGEWVDAIASSPAGRSGIVAPNGATVRVFDYPPGITSPMHRTESLDFGIVAHGSITLEMEGGETQTLKQGDVIVQRGTIHKWKNESNEWTRIYFVVLGAKPVEIGGQVLGESWGPVGQTAKP